MIYSLQALVQIFIPFLLVLIVFFLIYIFYKKATKQSLKETFKKDVPQILSTISTLLVFVTLLEMQTERLQTYKPIIVLETATGGCTFHINEDENASHQFAVFSTNLSDASMSGDVKIPIKNIGVGVANNLEMVFSIDFSANSKRYFHFEKEYPAYSLDDYRDHNEIVVDRRYMEGNSFLSSRDLDATNERLHYQSFILPNNQETLYVRLPVKYLSAIRQYIAYSQNIDIPPLYLTVKYEDVQGVKYSQKFYIEISLLYTTGSDIGEYVLNYTFTPEEGKSIEYGGESQNNPPEKFDYSNFDSHRSQGTYYS